MKIKKGAISIEGNEVEKADSVNGLDFYQFENGNEACIYICNGDAVLRKVSITADCGQNAAYISDISFDKVV